MHSFRLVSAWWRKYVSNGLRVMWGEPHRVIPVPGWPQLWVFPVGWGTLSLFLRSCHAAVLGGMSLMPLKPPELCTGEGLCGCWLQPWRCRAWFQTCLWRPVFNIKTNRRKWNLYYLLKTQVNRAEGSASKKPLGLLRELLQIFYILLETPGNIRKLLLRTAVEIPQVKLLIRGDLEPEKLIRSDLF